MKNVKIVLGGNAGSGKSTVGKMLAQKLGIPFVSVGDICRVRAVVMGMDINRFQEYLKSNPDFDRAMDAYIVQHSRSLGCYVLDYRLGFHFLPWAFKVLLKVSDEKAAQRIAGRQAQGEGFLAATVEQNTLLLNNMNVLMRQRFIELYGADFTDESRYDLVIETDNLTAGEIAEKTLYNWKNRK